jgi:predicted anti-sigma-YlaC factor YlaD
MTAHECAREPELTDALRAGAWPAGCDEELRAHAERCESCRDLVDVAAALLEDRDAQLHEASLPGSGLVWWKLQMRLRAETARKGRRILLLFQTTALSIAGALALFMLQIFVPGWVALVTAELPVAVQGFAPLFVLMAGLVLAGAPVAAYLASRKS